MKNFDQAEAGHAGIWTWPDQELSMGIPLTGAKGRSHRLGSELAAGGSADRVVLAAAALLLSEREAVIASQ